MKWYTSILITCFSILHPGQSKAQADTTAGIYIDGTFVDKISCWTFDQMYFVFPISEKAKEFDVVFLNIVVSYETSDPGSPFVFTFQETFVKDTFVKYFSIAKYGVWKFLIDKKFDKKITAFTESYGKSIVNPAIFRRNDFANLTIDKSGKYTGFKTTKYEVYAFVLGVNKSVGNNRVYLYKTPKIPVTNCVDCSFDINSKCEVTGKTIPLKIEKSLSHKQHLAIIK